jgi:23S rRNA (uridine2552-2'-O)-methyltransferase
VLSWFEVHGRVKGSKSSREWMRRHVSDPYVREARALGYRSRAAFKLLAIDARDHLFTPGQRVVDLGAAPGSWSQVAAEKVGAQGRVIAVDMLEIGAIPHVTVIQGDVTQASVLAAVQEALAGERLDLVLSDLSPNLSGIAPTDQARSAELCELALDFAREHLQPGGALLVKAFQGAGFAGFLRRMRGGFEQVVSRKPKASRSASSEMYLLGKNTK